MCILVKLAFMDNIRLLW